MTLTAATFPIFLGWRKKNRFHHNDSWCFCTSRTLVQAEQLCKPQRWAWWWAQKTRSQSQVRRIIEGLASESSVKGCSMSIVCTFYMVTHMFTCTVQPGRSHVREEHRLCCVLSYKQPEQYAGWGSNFNLSSWRIKICNPPLNSMLNGVVISTYLHKESNSATPSEQCVE